MISRSTKIITSLIVIILLSVGAWSYYGIINLHTLNLQKKAVERIGLYQNSLYNELTRFNFLPFVIARDQQLIDWSFKQSDQANLALEDIKQASGANEVYIMNASGVTLSSSNWRSKSSFINKNFAFRPYFQEAIQGRNGQFFGIGTTSKKPGFYISTGVKNKNKVVAVTVAKVDLSILEDIWTNAGENIFVTNRDGVVILSSKKQWKYRSLYSLEELQLQNIKIQRQFSNQDLNSLSDNFNAQSEQLNIDDTSYMHQEEKITNTDWTVHYLTPTNQIMQLATATWIKVGLALLVILSISLLLWLLQSRGKLKTSLKESEKLRELNSLLKTEIEHRHKVESELLIAQKNIKRTSKLAAMGQLSASIIHELGQPLSAMKTYIASAQLPPKNNSNSADRERTILPKLDALVERMNKISQQLQFFSHDNKKELVKVDIRDALKGALIIISPALKQNNVELLLQFEDRPYIIKGDQIRIEQVLVNLINNAKAAVEFSTIKKITIQIEIENKENIIVSIIDTGEGIPKETLQMLFDPFYTTKPSGVGLGLGLTISSNIIHKFNGTLTALNNKGPGSTFIITLPVSL